MRFLALAFAACSSTAVAPPIENRSVTTPPPATNELRATVRIDAEPGGKKFQGVWLEFSADKRFVIDYRPRWIWKGFENQEVVVTGHCYQPWGQAISATHFRVERMKFVKKPAQLAVPLWEIGPETVMKGAFVERTHPAGTKLAGVVETLFEADGTRYGIMAEETPPPPGPATIRARVVEVNMAHHAQTGGPKIWIADVLRGDPEPGRDEPMPCP